MGRLEAETGGDLLSSMNALLHQLWERGLEASGADECFCLKDFIEVNQPFEPKGKLPELNENQIMKYEPLIKL